MNYIPGRRPKPMKLAYKLRSCPQFRRWIKTRRCSVKGCQREDIDPSHIRCGLPPHALKGGTGIKSDDRWIIPLCRGHHDELGEGEPSFYARHKIDACAVSTALFDEWQRTTPAGQRFKKEQESGK